MSKRYFSVVSFLCLALFWSTSAVADLSPGLPISYATVEDYNMDGWLDIALTSEYGLILVYLGQSDGSFSGPIKSYCSGRPNVMDQADFNRDGLLDLVVGDAYGKIKFMLNAGKGEFAIKDDKTILGVSPRNFITFDFNADGKLDIAFADYSYNAVSFLYGKDVMEFDGPTSYPVPSPSAIAAADFDNDGLTDIVVASEGSNALYFLKQIEGKFEKKSQIQTGSRPVNMAVADFNHDNILDIVVVNKNSNKISLYRGKLEAGSYSWQSPTTYSVGGLSPSYASIADFNSDGYLDIAVACEGSNAVYFLLSTGLGNFTLSDKTLSTGSHPIQILAADFDNNGKSDLLTVNQGDQTISTFKDEDISTKLGFRLPEVDIKIRKNGEGDPVDGPLSVSTDVTDKIEIFGSLEANDCHGLKADFYLLLNAITPDLSGDEAVAKAKTYCIVPGDVKQGGIVEGEVPYATDLNITNIPEVPLWSFSTQDLANVIGTGSYSIIGKLVITGASGIVYYASDAAEFSITGRIISDPAVVTVKVDTTGGRIKASVDVEANEAAALMAFTYLWIDCSRTDTFPVEVQVDNETEIVQVEKTSEFTEWYSTTGWHSYHKEYNYDKVKKEIVEVKEGTKPDHIPPFTVWAVTDLTDYPLFDFPSSYFPSGYSCTIHAGFIIKDWGGMDYSVFDDESF